MDGSVTFESNSLRATITEDVTLTTVGKTTIQSGDVDLSSSGKITLLGSDGVFYPAAAGAAGVNEVGQFDSQVCQGADVIVTAGRYNNPANLRAVEQHAGHHGHQEGREQWGSHAYRVMYPFDTATGMPSLAGTQVEPVWAGGLRRANDAKRLRPTGP